MASTRTVALSATGLLAVIAAAVIGSNVGTEQADRKAASTSSSSAGATTSTSAPSSGRSTTPPPTPHASRTPTASPPVPTTPGSSDAPTGTGGGLEVLPTPAGEPAATGYSLPPITTTEPSPVVSGSLQPGTANGRLVAGFPTALAPPPGTEVESSSIAVAGDMVQAALVATGGDPEAIVAHYREVLTAHGYVEKKVQGVENNPAAAFKKGRNSITVTTGDGKTNLLAHLRAKGAAD
ncbi:hypothetical protein GCM10009798_32340 [Nocardioides panacihumi]|uniref:Uncharacterized protein n=1 Tax=Nocardioides panacihumi TaxID=400774 RepID=A0ABP5CUW1_9ACTN